MPCSSEERLKRGFLAFGSFQEKTTMEKRLDENDAYIVSLQEKIKALVNEKDTLTGRIRSLEDEGEQLRVCVKTTAVLFYIALQAWHCTAYFTLLFHCEMDVCWLDARLLM